MSTDLHTLSGAYALNALSADEAEAFATHLEHCPACREEVHEFRAVVATLGTSEADRPPVSLKARVLADADRHPQLPPKVSAIETARSRRWAPKVAGLVAAAAAVVVAVVGIGQLGSSESPTVPSASVAQVFKAPDAHRATVSTSQGRLTVATSEESGQMAIGTAELRTLSKERVYQMWAIHNGRATSVAVVDDLKNGTVMPIPASGTRVAVTVEPKGGSKQPTTRPLAQVDPASV